MAKVKTMYTCNNCGYQTPKWYGKCPDCEQWNSFVEEVVQAKPKSVLGTAPMPQNTVISKLSDISFDESERIDTGLRELNRVLGGGIVPGSVVLLSGDPGIGKSTILLQICEYLSAGNTILYVTGEESARQIKLRAQRLGVSSDNLLIVAATELDTVLSAINAAKANIVIVDSIQTMHSGALSSSVGSVSQVRECTSQLIGAAKSLEISIFIVGHVNKDGAIAGPKVLEHMVDSVLYFEGERHLTYRILRAVKNRYGSTNEIGVFEMTDKGLAEVENPSVLMLSGRPAAASGSCITAVMEGSRPILVEVQALVSKTTFGTPRRTASGFDYNRMALLIAVLEKRCGYFFGTLDVYLNVVGGLRLEETASDLSAALAMVSNYTNKPLDEHLLAIGEIGLAGELRSVGNVKARVKEAARLGYTKIILPRQNAQQLEAENITDVQLIGVRTVAEACKFFTA